MARRVSTTIILITRQDLVRADFASGSPPTVVDMVVQPRPDLPDMGQLVEAAINGSKPARQVWVLNSDLWTQTLALPAGRTAGMSESDLASALNFEAEGLSGQAAFESVVAQVPMSGSAAEKVWWLVQARATDRDAVEDAVNKAGSRLAGLLHPAGVPRALMAGTASKSGWIRAELWPDTVVNIQSQPNGVAAVHVVNSAPTLGQWQAEWNQRREAAGPGVREEMLVDVGVQPPATAKPQALIRLDDENVLRGWLTAWASVLNDKKATVPVIVPPRRPMTLAKRRKLAVAIAVLAIAGCYAHYLLLNKGIENAQADLRTASEPGQRMATMQKQLKDLQTNSEKNKTQQEKLWLQIAHLELQRQRHAKLFKFFSDNRPEHLMVEKIDNVGGEPRVFGVCWEPELADKFAAKLSQSLPEIGWKVETAKKITQDIVPGGGPCRFEIQLRVYNAPGTELLFTAGKGDNKARP